MTVSTADMTIAGPLVKLLRGRLKRELCARADLLRIELDANLTPERWNTALASFNEGCELMATIGLTDDPSQADVELDVRRWGRLILTIYEREYREGLLRIKDAEAEGYDPTLIGKNIPALGALVQEIQQRTGIRPKRGRPMSFLEEQLAKRRRGGRRRGDEQ
jgi:hypothetical protein